MNELTFMMVFMSDCNLPPVSGVIPASSISYSSREVQVWLGRRHLSSPELDLFIVIVKIMIIITIIGIEVVMIRKRQRWR